jgi:hypothetical protein
MIGGGGRGCKGKRKATVGDRCGDGAYPRQAPPLSQRSAADSIDRPKRSHRIASSDDPVVVVVVVVLAPPSGGYPRALPAVQISFSSFVSISNSSS